MKIKQKIVKIFAVLLVAVLLCVGAVGCTDEFAGKIRVRISVFNGGYGLDWLNALTDAYEANHDEVRFDVHESDRTSQETEIKSGVSDYDIYFGGLTLYNYVGTTQNTFADLSAVYESMDGYLLDTYEDWYRAPDGKYYSIPWGAGIGGIVYHESAMNEIGAAMGFDLPNTTDQLIDVAAKIKQYAAQTDQARSLYPFCYSLEDEYWNYMMEPWFAQYTGLTNWNNFWNGTDWQGRHYQNTIVADPGIQRSLEVLEVLLDYDNGYNHANSQTDNFTNAQFRFLSGQSVMMVNGDWLISEMNRGGNYTEEEVADVKMMKTPVISSIVEQLEDKNMTDDTLSAIIDEVDAGAESSTLCSQNDFNRIKEARNIVLSIGNINTVLVPDYADNRDIAIDFLKYMYSEEGVIAHASSGVMGLPVEHDFLNDSRFNTNPFLNSIYEMMNEGTMIFQSVNKDPIFAQNGLKLINNYNAGYVSVLVASHEKDRQSAEEIYTHNVEYVVGHWSTFMQNLQP